jgi:hypothetical protein
MLLPLPGAIDLRTEKYVPKVYLVILKVVLILRGTCFIIHLLFLSENFSSDS